MKRSDKVSCGIFVTCIPSMLLKGAVLGPPVVLYNVASRFQCHKVAKVLEYVMYSGSYVLNKLELAWITLLSILSSPWSSMRRWRRNRPVVETLEDNIGKIEPEWGQLSYNVYNAQQKEGFSEVCLKLLVMFSCLPTIRHCFLNNPWLFDYKLYYTNQESPRITNSDGLSNVVFSYIGDPKYLIELERNCGEWSIDEIGFTPNYFNCKKDRVLDWNNMGLQIGAYFATNIYLDTVLKDPESIQAMIKGRQKSHPSTTIASSQHRVHRCVNLYRLQVRYDSVLDPLDRVKILDLVVPYKSMYHIVTGRVEANVKDYQIIEHPMFCLTHDGLVMTSLWNSINNLFTNYVMKYLAHCASHGGQLSP